MQDKNQEISKQNVGDDPIDRPKVTKIVVQIKTGLAGNQCFSDIRVELNNPHQNNYPYTLTLKFSTFQYTIPSLSYENGNIMTCSNIIGKIYSNPNQATVNVEISNQSGGVVDRDSATYVHSDHCIIP